MIFPPNPFSADDLTCSLFPGTVDPGPTPTYEYTRHTEGSGSTSPQTVVIPPKAELFDELSASFTTVGEVWTCTARTYDGTDFSAPSNRASSDVIQERLPSTLTLEATPLSLTLGDVVSLSGSVVRQAEGGPEPVPFAGVSFDNSISPPGSTETDPLTLLTDPSGNFANTFFPDEAGSWTAADGETSDDLWVHFTAQDGWAFEEWIETLSGAVTLSGDPVVSDYAQFLISSCCGKTE